MSTNNNRAFGGARKGLSVLTASAAAKWENVFSQPTAAAARALIGAWLCRTLPDDQPDGGELMVGRIVETEAYLPLVDPACHGYRGPTPRNAAMFGRPGHAYIYFIYGNHYCFNVTTEPAGIGGAVLVRALEPVHGIEAMRRRRPGVPDAAVARGPGNLCRALGIDRTSNGVDLRAGQLRIELPEAAGKGAVSAGPRIGIREAAAWPMRFIDPSSASVSPFRQRASVSDRTDR